ncbi:hypothetical protein CEUSTIGMA_g11126.t1 [Chlamydomonas eustigma]|uniref:Uncharacterized protein n=1 Tax=Chlamydomonas eustigma TaxID=1157962 RepID=A0A250XKS6_9CHLO|nr:hypothetical protein CEUSTIGMA_g11126.t1 [Chlamydomonas eustigma]|eukprot:GAX83701.1 hypothetical protein CEUSTIGMA_g11126.t1 [Chlamydomonas eustigma]
MSEPFDVIQSFPFAGTDYRGFSSQDTDGSIPQLLASQQPLLPLSQSLPIFLAGSPERHLALEPVENQTVFECQQDMSTLYNTAQNLGTLLQMDIGSSPPKQHHSLQKEEHRNSRAHRRGPMDEMRQLVRILVKLMPQSAPLLTSTDDGGGGNRVSEEQIKIYLKNLLGDAPAPTWGIPDGWGDYLAQLFTWASGRFISKEDAMQCARRLPGRSWETVESELAKLGLYPNHWVIPLDRKKVQEVNHVCHANGNPPHGLPALAEAAALAMDGFAAANASDTSIAAGSDGEDREAAAHLLEMKGGNKRPLTSKSDPNPQSFDATSHSGQTQCVLVKRQKTDDARSKEAAAVKEWEPDKRGVVNPSLVSELGLVELWHMASLCVMEARQRMRSAVSLDMKEKSMILWHFNQLEKDLEGGLPWYKHPSIDMSQSTMHTDVAAASLSVPLAPPLKAEGVLLKDLSKHLASPPLSLKGPPYQQSPAHASSLHSKLFPLNLSTPKSVTLLHQHKQQQQPGCTATAANITSSQQPGCTATAANITSSQQPGCTATAANITSSQQPGCTATAANITSSQQPANALLQARQAIQQRQANASASTTTIPLQQIPTIKTYLFTQHKVGISPDVSQAPAQQPSGPSPSSATSLTTARVTNTVNNTAVAQPTSNQPTTIPTASSLENTAPSPQGLPPNPPSDSTSDRAGLSSSIPSGGSRPSPAPLPMRYSASQPVASKAVASQPVASQPVASKAVASKKSGSVAPGTGGSETRPATIIQQASSPVLAALHLSSMSLPAPPTGKSVPAAPSNSNPLPAPPTGKSVPAAPSNSNPLPAPSSGKSVPAAPSNSNPLPAPPSGKAHPTTPVLDAAQKARLWAVAQAFYKMQRPATLSANSVPSAASSSTGMPLGFTSAPLSGSSLASYFKNKIPGSTLLISKAAVPSGVSSSATTSLLPSGVSSSATTSLLPSGVSSSATTSLLPSGVSSSATTSLLPSGVSSSATTSLLPSGVARVSSQTCASSALPAVQPTTLPVLTAHKPVQLPAGLKMVPQLSSAPELPKSLLKVDLTDSTLSPGSALLDQQGLNGSESKTKVQFGAPKVEKVEEVSRKTPDDPVVGAVRS